MWSPALVRTGPDDLPAAQAVQSQYTLTQVTSPKQNATHLASAATTAYQLIRASNWSLNSVSNATQAFSIIMGLADAFPPSNDTAGTTITSNGSTDLPPGRACQARRVV